MREIKNSFWDFIAIGGSNLLAIPFMIVSESIQANNLGTSGYGKVSLAYSAIMLLFLYGINWLTASVVRFGKEEFINYGHLRKTVSSYLFSVLIAFFPLVILFILFHKPFFRFLEIEQSQSLWLILIGVVIQVGKTLSIEILKAIRLIKVQTFLMRLGSKLFLLAGIFLLTFDFIAFSITNVIIAFLLSDLIVAVAAAGFIKRKYIFPLLFDKNQLKTILLFSLPLFLGGLLNSAVDYMDAYTIKHFMSIEDVGIYQAAFKIFKTLGNFVSMGIPTIITVVVYAMKAENKTDKMMIFLRRIVPQIVFAVFVLISMVIVFSDIAFDLIYGEEFKNSIVPFKILSAVLVFRMISLLINSFYFAFNMTKVVTLLGVLSELTHLGADILFVKHFGINGAAYATILSGFIFSIIKYLIIYKKFKIKRYISFLFCVLIVVIMVINIAPISYLIRIMLSFTVILLTIFTTREYNLFNKKDIDFLDSVNMPEVIRKYVAKFITLMSK